VFAAIGQRFIRTVNLWMMRRGDLNVIYGANENSISLAEKLKKESRSVTVFVDGGDGSVYDGQILRMGSLLLGDEIPTEDLLRRLGVRPGGRKLTVFCLKDPESNALFAENLLTALQGAGIPSSQTELSILVDNESAGEELQASQLPGQERFGFGSVHAVESASLAARLMIRTFPPYRRITFDGCGNAQEDMEVLVVGFGLTGQAVLRHLIMNGMFNGSRFHATVIARNYSEAAGSFFYRYPGLRSGVSIDFVEDNARSVRVYSTLEEKGKDLKYVAVCTGSEKENREIAGELSAMLRVLGSKAVVVQVTHRGVRTYAGELRAELFTPDVLLGTQLDAMAKVINHRYHLAEGRTAEEDWDNCDYFSRMSCRASADFLNALLRSVGLNRRTALETGWEPEGEVLESLSRTEHLRWNAFHYAMGYQTMPDEVYRQRAEMARRQTEEQGSSDIRPGKDAVRRLHACLVPWDELDEVSRRESEVSGKTVDYKEMDRENIRSLPAMLRAASGKE
jgi:hypothetical protein